MQGYQYPEWRQVADVADDLDGLQEEGRSCGRREKRSDKPTHQEEPLPLPFEREVPLEVEVPLPLEVEEERLAERM